MPQTEQIQPEEEHMFDEKTLLLSFGEQKFNKAQIIALADEGKFLINQAIIVKALESGLVAYGDFRKARMGWINPEVIRRWGENTVVLPHQIEVLKTVDVTPTRVSAPKPEVIALVLAKTIDVGEPHEVIHFGSWTLDMEKKRLWWAERSCRVPSLEVQMLKILMQAQGEKVSYRELHKPVITLDAKTTVVGRVQASMSLLRRLIKQVRPEHEPIFLVPGEGYRFNA